MIALVRSELLKLRTLRSTAWAAAALLAITLLTAGLAMNAKLATHVVVAVGRPSSSPPSRQCSATPW